MSFASVIFFSVRNTVVSSDMAGAVQDLPLPTVGQGQALEQTSP